MRIRVVSSKDEINTLEYNEQIVHFTFRPSNEDILSLVTQCPDVKAIHISQSHKKTISKSTEMLLEMQDIILIVGNIWGHRKDINQYVDVSKGMYHRINHYRANGFSDVEIEARLIEEMYVSADIIQFFLKNGE
ncbi:DUF1699 family protein [Methanolobus sp.]|uniref:DUF1699 family protein n=1 Tax=Methanolobus sp. TaxID=1874737 RepID=UPI0025D3039D|nr:DUF1699 family protein [Methanolobus sp.]